MIESAMNEGFALRPYAKPDRDWVFATHVEHYRAVEHLGSTFDAAVSRALADIDKHIGNDRT